jgi:hypothetical protein
MVISITLVNFIERQLDTWHDLPLYVAMSDEEIEKISNLSVKVGEVIGGLRDISFSSTTRGNATVTNIVFFSVSDFPVSSIEKIAEVFQGHCSSVVVKISHIA